jgi:hypothetical protein
VKISTNIFAVFLCVGSLLAAEKLQPMAQPLTFYVATNGNDAWSGRLARPAGDGSDGPLRTPAAALRAARKAGSATPAPQSVTILFRAGRHELAEPLTLTDQDSGKSADRPFTLAAFPNEQPVLSGGRPLTGWKASPGPPGRWQAELPEVRAGQWYFRQLFVNGPRATGANAECRLLSHPGSQPAGQAGEDPLQTGRNQKGMGG